MKKDKKTVTFFKQKSYLLAAALMLAAVLGMTGVYVAQQNEEKKQQEDLAEKQQAKLAQQEKTKQENAEQGKQEDKETPKTAAVDQMIEAENDDFMDEPDVISSSNQAVSQKEDADDENAKEDENEETEGETTAQSEETGEEETTETSAVPSQPELHFDAASEMGWPLSGNVILNFSKDQTIYFATLDQYKTNEALVIQGNVNDRVSSVADGVVTNIEYDRPETGCTVTVDLGDGYSAVYGQLKEVPLNAGDYIEAGDVIGYVSEPTKYYSVEGPNLYFQIIKDNEAIDPMGFLQ